MHSVLVLLGLGGKGWGGNQLSVGDELMAHRQELLPRLLDAEGSGERTQRNAGRKVAGPVLRAELAEWNPMHP